MFIPAHLHHICVLWVPVHNKSVHLILKLAPLSIWDRGIVLGQPRAPLQRNKLWQNNAHVCMNPGIETNVLVSCVPRCRCSYPTGNPVHGTAWNSSAQDQRASSSTILIIWSPTVSMQRQLCQVLTYRSVLEQDEAYHPGCQALTIDPFSKLRSPRQPSTDCKPSSSAWMR